MSFNCDKCFRDTDELFTSVYGVRMCKNCWYDYLFSDVGKVEYIVSIVNSDCKMSDFDADFLGECAVQWHKNKCLFDMSIIKRLIIECRAKRLGIL